MLFSGHFKVIKGGGGRMKFEARQDLTIGPTKWQDLKAEII